MPGSRAEQERKTHTKSWKPSKNKERNPHEEWRHPREPTQKRGDSLKTVRNPSQTRSYPLNKRGESPPTNQALRNFSLALWTWAPFFTIARNLLCKPLSQHIATEIAWWGGGVREEREGSTCRKCCASPRLQRLTQVLERARTRFCVTGAALRQTEVQIAWHLAGSVIWPCRRDTLAAWSVDFVILADSGADRMLATKSVLGLRQWLACATNFAPDLAESAALLRNCPFRTPVSRGIAARPRTKQRW